MTPQKPSIGRKYETGQQQPSIGHVVHYWVLNSEECQETPNPAVITRVRADGAVDLHVLGDLPTGTPMRYDVAESDGRAGTWRWPPRTSDTPITEREVLTVAQAISPSQVR